MMSLPGRHLLSRQEQPGTKPARTAKVSHPYTTLQELVQFRMYSIPPAVHLIMPSRKSLEQTISMQTLQRTTDGGLASRICREKIGTGALQQGAQAAGPPAMAAARVAGLRSRIDLQQRAPGTNQVLYETKASSGSVLPIRCQMLDAL